MARTITFTSPTGKFYKLDQNPANLATLLVRPRGWHLDEKHFLVDGEPVSASIFDFAVFFYNSAWLSIKAGQGPYFYLPKMEGHLEARYVSVPVPLPLRKTSILSTLNLAMRHNENLKCSLLIFPMLHLAKLLTEIILSRPNPRTCIANPESRHSIPKPHIHIHHPKYEIQRLDFGLMSSPSRRTCSSSPGTASVQQSSSKPFSQALKWTKSFGSLGTTRQASTVAVGITYSRPLRNSAIIPSFFFLNARTWE